ncbi:MAG TPA: hypothetical protein VKM55_14535 [Candidatus Lokiarchaeia archaeon]|nr:hypothetical protein [Candidatus Lokiarchaeia archaeon]
MYQELFVYPAIGAFVLLIIHSWLTRGKRFTMLFFLGGFAFGFVRELIYVNFKQIYDYSGLLVKILGVSPVIPIGWVFTFYIGICFTERIFGFSVEEIAAELHSADAKRVDAIITQRLIPMLIGIALFTGIVSFTIESTAINMGWWRFIYFHGEYVPSTVQYMWMQTSIIFMLIFFLAYFKEIRCKKTWIFLAVFTAKYAAEDFVFQYLPPAGQAILWILVFIAPLFFYHEFSIYYLIILLCGEIYPRVGDAYLPAFAGDVLVAKIVFFVPQAIYFMFHLHPFHKASRTRFTHAVKLHAFTIGEHAILHEMKKFEVQDWDGEGAAPISRETVEVAILFARNVHKTCALEGVMIHVPKYKPLANGEVSIEWEKTLVPFDLHVMVPVHGTNNIFTYFGNGKEESGSLTYAFDGSKSEEEALHDITAFIVQKYLD